MVGDLLPGNHAIGNFQLRRYKRTADYGLVAGQTQRPLLGRKVDLNVGAIRWRVAARAAAHINDAECLELVVSRRPATIMNGSYCFRLPESGRAEILSNYVINIGRIIQTR